MPIKVWNDPHKGAGNLLIPNGENFYRRWQVGSPPGTMWVEGKETASFLSGESGLRLWYTPSDDYPWYPGAAQYNPDLVSVTIVEVDMDMLGLVDDDEESVGGYIALGGEKQLTLWRVQPRGLLQAPGVPPAGVPLDSGHPMTLDVKYADRGSGLIEIWDYTTKLTLPKTYTSEESLPAYPLRVKGTSASSMRRGITIIWEYSIGGRTVQDRIKCTVVEVDLHATDKDGVMVPNQDEENPGVLIHFNLDNDNDSDNSEPASWPQHPGADYAEVTSGVVGEDDVKALTMSLSPSFDFGYVVLSVPMGFRLWKDDEKGASNLVLDCSNSAGNKTWDLSNSAQKTEFLDLCSSLYVEGTAVITGDVVLSYRAPTEIEISRDVVDYWSVAAVCGNQPKTLKPPYYYDKGTDKWSEREYFETCFPGLVRCEWSVTGPDPDGVWPYSAYNCIAHSADRGFEWLNPWDIDKHWGDDDGIFEDCDMDEYYWNEKGWVLITSGTDEYKAFLGEAMYYSYDVPWDYLHDPEPVSGYHAARRSHCWCGMLTWVMYTAKPGKSEQIEHVWDQLNGSEYGEPDRFYYTPPADP